jgi:hypothetical protein
MVAKKIDLGPGLQFLSIAHAKKDYFGKILKDTPINQRITKEEFDALKLLYERYCSKTNWQIPSPPKAFFPTHDKYGTVCFGIEFEDGSTYRFSLDKALSAVAN